MKLFYSPASPFVRKVTVTAHETGLFDRIEPVPTTVAPVQPNPELARQNPLMKLPTLVTDDGEWAVRIESVHGLPDETPRQATDPQSLTAGPTTTTQGD